MSQGIREAAERLLSLNTDDRTGEWYEEYKNIVAVLLKNIDSAAPFGEKLFNAVAGLSYTIAFEAVAFRKNPGSGQPEVFLRRRSVSDPAYPFMWHCPGSV